MTTGNPTTMTTPDAYAVPAAVNESTTPGDFETTIRTTEQQLDIGSGQLANLEVYNGRAPGPTLFLDKDDTVTVRLINKLPEIASSLPKPDELKSISLSGVDGIGPLVSDLTKLVNAVRT